MCQTKETDHPECMSGIKVHACFLSSCLGVAPFTPFTHALASYPGQWPGYKATHAQSQELHD